MSNTSNWKSGMPIATEADVVAWKAWRAERRRELQRRRRACNPRIDYYPDEEAERALRMVWQPRKSGLDKSSALNILLADWLKLRGL
jgi:hypothetical protein